MELEENSFVVIAELKGKTKLQERQTEEGLLCENSKN